MVVVGKHFTFCLLWFSGNPRFTAKMYCFAPFPTPTKSLGLCYRETKRTTGAPFFGWFPLDSLNLQSARNTKPRTLCHVDCRLVKQASGQPHIGESNP